MWSDALIHSSLLRFLIFELVQVLFLSRVVNFQYFNSYFHVTNSGQDPFSGAYLKMLLFLWCYWAAVSMCFTVQNQKQPASETSCFF